MDVDLLRPGTLPISPDTILWFEYLLDQKLLKEHLQYPFPEPAATDLIIEFLSVGKSDGLWNGRQVEDGAVKLRAPPTPPAAYGPDSHEITRKQLALKILALKTASTLKWNLDTFESKMPPLIQQELLQDLVYMASDGAFSKPPQEFSMKMLQMPQLQFALTLYHRWILRFPVKAALQAKSEKLPFIHLPGMPLENEYNFDKMLRINESSRIQSIRFLEEVVAYYESPVINSKELKLIKVPVMETFVQLTADTDVMAHNWDAGNTYICHYELLMQIHFDLCYNYFFNGQHEKAKKHILGCRKNLILLEDEICNKGYGPYDKMPWGHFNYASVSEENILGYIHALNLGYEVLHEEPSLLQRLQESIANEYVGIVTVLQADNVTREMPMIHRQVVELDIQASASTGAIAVPEDLVIRVSALNAVRYALEGGLPSTHSDFLNKFKTFGITFFDVLFWALAPVLMSTRSDDDWNKLRMFFLHLTTSQCNIPIDKIDEYLKKHVGVYASEIRSKLISEEHLETIINDQINSDDENMCIPRELLSDDWEASEYKLVPELEMGRLKKRLIAASTADDVRTCLKLAVMSSSPLWNSSPHWKPIGDLGVSLACLPGGFLHEFGVSVSAAARARAEAGDARAAVGLLSALEDEARGQLGDPALHRLCRALSWETLLLQVDLMLAEWPHHRLDLAVLGDKCKAAIAAANSGDTNGPRAQVVLAARVCLLNTGEWEAGAGGGAGELAAALCGACAQLQRGEGGHFSRTLWDYVLSTFANEPTTLKRSIRLNYHGPTNHANHHGQLDHRTAYHALLQALREPLAISVILSLLARIYNVLVDDSSMELVVEYTNLWPNNISNANSYNPKCILESLNELLERSLKLYPSNTSWLRLSGDVSLAGARAGAALRRYLLALSAESGHFARRARGEGAAARRARGEGAAARRARGEGAAARRARGEGAAARRARGEGAAARRARGEGAAARRARGEGAAARRAARAAAALAARAQAAALCQLPDETDYAPAFKWLAEKSGNDATDAYYGCFWDATLLEVIVAQHARRGEWARCARAVRAAGALELNASNGDGVRRKAAAVRRARLLRALTSQYVS